MAHTGSKDKHPSKAPLRRNTVEARERAATARDKALRSREQLIRSEECSADYREHAVLTREEALQLMENLLKSRERAAVAEERRHLLGDLMAANEKLLLMSIRSQDLADEAEEARRKLELSESELRTGMEFRERLVGIVSHDLRNPINAISMSSQLLLRLPHLDEKTRVLATRIGGSTRRMGEMTADLLDFTRVHAGSGIPVERKATNLEEVCGQVVEELEAGHSAPKRFHCEFHGNLDGDWDSDRLGQVISNLGGNAIQYAAPDTRISIKAEAEGTEVSLAISNQGQPIPSGLIPFIFDPFLRARENGKANRGGLGLGLHISYEIVRSHGGSISVRSTAKEGTTFTIRLPRTPAGLRDPLS